MLKEISKKQLLELKFILNQITESDYNKPLPVLSDSTIGKHVRHILEFYECLFVSCTDDVVCYDHRKRNLLLEENVRFTSGYITEITDMLDKADINKRLLLKAIYEDADFLMESSLYREITYNIEHTVHHLAIIKIAIASALNYIQLPKDFGYAQSTISYLKTQKAS